MIIGSLLIGFCLGARFRVQSALAAALEKLKAAAAAAGEDDKDGGDDNDTEEEAEEDKMEKMLEQFMSREWLSGLDDHPETELNPILIYQIKKAKEEMRQRHELEAKLIARGLEADHLDNLSPEERKALVAELKGDNAVVLKSNVGSVQGVERKYGRTVNSTSILVKAGARFTPGASDVSKLDNVDLESAEKKASEEIRGRLKIIDGHLQTTFDVDVTRSDVKRTSMTLKAGVGTGLVKNALEKAKETKLKPYGDDYTRRFAEMTTYAARGRARVATPLDHALTAANEKNARRASCGAARRASVSRGGGHGGASRQAGADADRGGGAIEDKMRRASQLLGTQS